MRHRNIDKERILYTAKQLQDELQEELSKGRAGLMRVSDLDVACEERGEEAMGSLRAWGYLTVKISGRTCTICRTFLSTNYRLVGGRQGPEFVYDVVLSEFVDDIWVELKMFGG